MSASTQSNDLRNRILFTIFILFISKNEFLSSKIEPNLLGLS